MWASCLERIATSTELLYFFKSYGSSPADPKIDRILAVRPVVRRVSSHSFGGHTFFRDNSFLAIDNFNGGFVRSACVQGCCMNGDAYCIGSNLVLVVSIQYFLLY